MSVSQPGSNNGNTATGAAQQSNPSGDQPNVMRANAFLRRDFQYRSNAVEIQHYLEAIDKQLTPEMKKTYRFIALDDPSSLAISALIMTGRWLAGGKEHVFFYTLQIEATSRVSSFTDNVNGQQVEITRVASDALDEKMFAAVRQKVAEIFPGARETMHNCGAAVVHTTVDPKNDEQIHNVLVMAGRAVQGHMVHAFGDEPPFSVTWIPKDTRIQSRISYTPAPVVDASGSPLRTDVSVEVVSKLVRGQGPQGIHNEERTLTHVGGFVDLIFTTPPPVQFQGQIVPSQRYYPRFVVTSIRSALDAETLETRLFGLVSGGLLMAKNMNWGGVFLTRHGVDPKHDLRDIGAVGYEVPLDASTPNVPLGKKLKTHDATFTRENLGELIRAAFHPQLVISFDAIELGPDWWLDETFVLAARNHPDAVAAILQAANNLTGGHFKNLFKGGPILVDNNNRIHLGYYSDDLVQGQKSDIRNLDYLALLNLVGDKTLQPVIDWDKSFEDGMVDPRIRMETRLKILRSRYEDRMTINGFARRLTFTANFLTALADACVQAGLDIRQESPQLDFANNSGRGYYDVSAYGLGVNAVNGLFNAGAQYYAGIGMPGSYGGYTTRW